MSLTDYVTLGCSGLRVSPICLGAMTFGEERGWGSSDEESKEIIDRFVNAGGNFIDTANGYSPTFSGADSTLQKHGLPVLRSRVESFKSR